MLKIYQREVPGFILWQQVARQAYKVEFRLELNRKVSLEKEPLVGRLGTLGPMGLRDAHDAHGAMGRNLVFANNIF